MIPGLPFGATRLNFNTDIVKALEYLAVTMCIYTDISEGMYYLN